MKWFLIYIILTINLGILVSISQPAGQNRPIEGSNPAHWMTLQSVKKRRAQNKS